MPLKEETIQKQLWYQSPLTVGVVVVILTFLGSLITTLLPMMLSEKDFYVTVEPVYLEPTPLEVPPEIIDNLYLNLTNNPQINFQKYSPIIANVKIENVNDIWFKKCNYSATHSKPYFSSETS